jgi:hypothetical protein
MMILAKKLERLSIYHLSQGIILEKTRVFIYLFFVARYDPGKKARSFVYQLFVARSDPGKKLERLSIYHLWQGLVLAKKLS